MRYGNFFVNLFFRQNRKPPEYQAKAGNNFCGLLRILRDKLDFLLSRVNEDVTIISGCARGADSLGERYAKERGLTLLRMSADWQKHGH